MKRFGIDISRWQRNFDFNAAKNEGVTFAIIKGGGGDDGLYTDVCFNENYLKAKALGIPVGVYWFSMATTVDRALEEAEYFFRNVLSGKSFELPIFIDVEHQRMLSLEKEKLTDVVDAWCRQIESLGGYVGIYASVSTFNNRMDDERLSRYVHWVAQWAEECTYKNKDILGFWQFGGDTNLLRKNTVAGVVCDQNYMYYDYPAVIRDMGFNDYTDYPPFSVDPPPSSKTDEQLAEEVMLGVWGNGKERVDRITSAGYDYEKIQRLVDALVEKKISSASLKAGDMARMNPDATVYGTSKRFDPFVYKELLYVRELNGDRAVISIVPDGPVTGAVRVDGLKKVTP